MIKTKNVHSKILGFIENKDIKDIIEWAIRVCRNLFIVMIIILLGFICIPSANWGWLDRNTMISSVSTLIGGLFGLIAGVIGIVATYGAFYIGVKTEKEKIEKEKSDQRDFELSVLQKLLEHTLDETSMLASIIVDTYVEFYKKHDIIEILHYRCYENDLVFERMLEEISIHKSVTVNREIARGLIESVEGKLSREDELYSNVLKIKKEDYMDLYYEIQRIYSEYGDFRRLVYTGDWDKYILQLKDHEGYKFTDIKDIINWMTFLTSDTLGNYTERILRLEDNKLMIESTRNNNTFVNTTKISQEIRNIKQSQVTTIMKFIEYRNNVIDVLETMFDNYEVENDILSSDEEIRHKINYKEWEKEKKMNLDENETIKG